MERERLLNEKIKQSVGSEQADAVEEQQKTYLGLKFDEINRMGGNIPGFQMLKDRVLKPLIVATEKVVEYYLNDDQEK